MSKYIFIQTPPTGTGYHANTLANVPEDMAARFIYDGNALDAEKMVDPAPFFNPKTVSKIKDADLQSFVDDTEDKISETKDRLNDLSDEAARLDQLIEKVKGQMTKEKSAYERNKLFERREALEKKSVEVSTEIRETYPELKVLKIEFLNANARLKKLTFAEFKDNKLIPKIKDAADDILELNTKLIAKYKEATEGMSVPFISNKPFLTGTAVTGLQKAFVDFDNTVDTITEQLVSRYTSELLKMYEEAVETAIMEDQ